ncbi:MAG TPA: heme o synthase [Thermoplasmata archaeon]|nr:heme o synthase [Thermoplasmata archaeon]
MSEVASARTSALPTSSRFSDAVSLAKPGITLLIVLVAVGGYFLANPTAIDWYRLLLLVLTGAAASAGAAMLNHYLDRDVDPQMHRTSDRPLAAERIASSTAVLIAGLAFLAVGIGAASALLNPLTGFSIFLGGFTYVVVYTAWLKRRSSWNIVIGGFAGSAPALAGSAAAVGYWSTGSIAFAILVFLWTPPHFWSLALLLKDDYARAGLPMLPRMNDAAYSGKVVVISAALLVPAALLVGWTGAITWPILVVLVVLGLLFVMFTLPLWKRVDRATARRGFIYSGPYLLFVILALIVNVPLLRFGIPTGFG